MAHEIISDTPVIHRSDAKGLRIGRQQIVKINGQIFRCDYWYQWETGSLHHVDSVPV